jgi:hypothetical protein
MNGHGDCGTGWNMTHRPFIEEATFQDLDFRHVTGTKPARMADQPAKVFCMFDGVVHSAIVAQART